MNPIPDPCLPFDEDLSALHDGELDAARAAAVRAHVAACERCRALLARFGAVDAALRGTAAPAVSPALEAAVLARVARASGAEAAPRDRSPARASGAETTRRTRSRPVSRCGSQSRLRRSSFPVRLRSTPRARRISRSRSSSRRSRTST